MKMLTGAMDLLCGLCGGALKESHGHEDGMRWVDHVYGLYFCGCSDPCWQALTKRSPAGAVAAC